MLLFFFFFKQKTAYEMRISDWSSDVCSSDLCRHGQLQAGEAAARSADIHLAAERRHAVRVVIPAIAETTARGQPEILRGQRSRSEEHTSELQSLMRISYAVFCLQKKTPITITCTVTHIHTERVT